MTHPSCNLSIYSIGTLILCLMFFGCHTQPSSREAAAADTTILPLPRTENGHSISTLDKSPMDIIYYPPEYPKLKMMGKIKSGPVFRIMYSRPQKNGREVFGTVVKYGEHWRLGANEATEIEFFEDVVIQDTKVPQGRYVLYCIPLPAEWTLILNSDLYSWGLRIDDQKDIFKFTVPAAHVNSTIEAFTMETEKTSEGALLWIGWDHTRVALPVQLPLK